MLARDENHSLQMKLHALQLQAASRTPGTGAGGGGRGQLGGTTSAGAAASPGTPASAALGDNKSTAQLRGVIVKLQVRKS